MATHPLYDHSYFVLMYDVSSDEYYVADVEDANEGGTTLSEIDRWTVGVGDYWDVHGHDLFVKSICGLATDGETNDVVLVMYLTDGDEETSAWLYRAELDDSSGSIEPIGSNPRQFWFGYVDADCESAPLEVAWDWTTDAIFATSNFESYGNVEIERFTIDQDGELDLEYDWNIDGDFAPVVDLAATEGNLIVATTGGTNSLRLYSASGGLEDTVSNDDVDTISFVSPYVSTSPYCGQAHSHDMCLWNVDRDWAWGISPAYYSNWNRWALVD